LRSFPVPSISDNPVMMEIKHCKGLDRGELGRQKRVLKRTSTRVLAWKAWHRFTGQKGIAGLCYTTKSEQALCLGCVVTVATPSPSLPGSRCISVVINLETTSSTRSYGFMHVLDDTQYPGIAKQAWKRARSGYISYTITCGLPLG